MKYIVLILTTCLVLTSAPAMAGRGAGGVHSNDATNISRYNERKAEERDIEERRERGESVEEEERATDAEVEAKRKEAESKRIYGSNPRH